MIRDFRKPSSPVFLYSRGLRPGKALQDYIVVKGLPHRSDILVPIQRLFAIPHNARVTMLLPSISTRLETYPDRSVLFGSGVPVTIFCGYGRVVRKEVRKILGRY